MCDVWKQQFRDELTAEEVKGLIDQAIEMGVKTIYFTGGEAFLRRDIFELIDYATRPGMITTVNTNGSFITKEMAEKIVLSKLRSIQFSIDSPIAEKHNFMRGKNVFEKAVQAMEYINYYKERLGRRAEDNLEGGLDMVIVSVIMKSNIEELAGLVELAEKTQCCGILFQPLINNGNLLENFNFDSDFWVEEEDVPRLEETFRKLEQMKNQMPPGVFIEFMPEKTIQHFRRQRRANTCFAGFNRIFVNPQGDISFVCFPSFGNVRANRLENVWHSEKAYEFRERLKNCQVNCTQFCSERPASESIEAIHRSLLEGIKKFPKKTQIKLLIKEYIFLQSIPILNNWSNRNNYDHKKEKAS
ncbi:MAG: radical SAM protein [Candidatus Omnitrophica bacterium]|nr:radical SAM protein [Candidatus Omnitrophota bacterium]